MAFPLSLGCIEDPQRDLWSYGEPLQCCLQNVPLPHEYLDACASGDVRRRAHVSEMLPSMRKRCICRTKIKLTGQSVMCALRSMVPPKRVRLCFARCS